MRNEWVATSFKGVFQWAQANSLWYLTVGGNCCANEVLQARGCRYDLERFGCLEENDPGHADLLIVNGLISFKAVDAVKKIYDDMPSPKYVLAVGSCACSGGLFAQKGGYSVIPGVHQIIPVDVYVPGCPPRPEAIMDGLLKLRERISGKQRS